MRRLFIALMLVLGCLAVPVAAQGVPPTDPTVAGESAIGSWAEPQIRVVIARGLMGGSLATFRPDDVLTRGELSELIADLSHPDTASAPPSTSSSRAVTMAGLDARLVRALGLTASANHFLTAARDAGLSPPSRFGSEVVARLLGLRTNHLVPRDDLELLPDDAATRAEGAFSAARLLALGSDDLQAIRAAAAALTLPELDEWQRRVLDVAVGLIGFPYVWGGSSERTQKPFGTRAPGGFDCSGFVWRVYKLESYENGAPLAATLKGRTTYTMSGEVPKALRVPFAQLQPADVIFFGERGPKSKPNDVDHMGIYVGDGFFIHSSESGVALARIAGWYRTRFAWARRPLAEAGLRDRT